MTQEWKALWELVAQNGAINAEQAMDITKQQDPNANISTLTEMRDKFLDLKDKIHNDQVIEGMDFVNLWTGASISCALIEKNIRTWQAVVDNYRNSLLPKLYEIASAVTEPEKQRVLFEEYFSKNIWQNKIFII